MILSVTIAEPLLETQARRMRGRIAGGADPAGERAKSRDMPSLADFAERYVTAHARIRKKASSCALDERNLHNHVLPALGRLPLDNVTREDVARFHAAMNATPVAANRCLALLSKMFALSESWGLRPDGSNPTRHIEKYPERKVERFLSNAELARPGTVLEEAAGAGEHPSAVAAIRLLISSHPD